MTASVPRDPFAVAAGRIDPDGTAATRLVPTRLSLVATTPPPELVPVVVPSDAEPADAEPAGAAQSDAAQTQPEDPSLHHPFRPLSRDLDHRHLAPEARAPRHDHLTPRYSRLARSAVTFGPVGRIVLTVVLLAIPAFLLWVSLAWILFDGIYLFFVVPALRDVWQAVRVPVAAPISPEGLPNESGPEALRGVGKRVP
jgi:hypothetical protein